MNKTEFLDELKNCLAVLEEKEQRDILEEYTLNQSEKGTCMAMNW